MYIKISQTRAKFHKKKQAAGKEKSRWERTNGVGGCVVRRNFEIAFFLTFSVFLLIKNKSKSKYFISIKMLIVEITNKNV